VSADKAAGTAAIALEVRMAKRLTVGELAHELGVTGSQLVFTAKDLGLRLTRVGAQLTRPQEQALRDAFERHLVNVYRSDPLLRVSRP
jgi:hypothetical protein